MDEQPHPQDPNSPPLISASQIIDDILDAKSRTQLKQVRDIVSIEEWLESPFYVGEDGLQLYDFWKIELTELFQPEKFYNEWVVTGSLGGGKSTAGEFAILRKLYELSCWEPIPLLFEMMKSTILYFIYFTVSLKQAQRTGYGSIKRIVDGIPYFLKYFPRNLAIDSELQFPGMSMVYGSDVGHQIGMNLIGSLLDETNFLDKNGRISDDFSKATELYRAVYNRRKSRFVVEGIDKGLSIFVSSATTVSSFTEERIAAADEDPHIMVSSVVTYQVKRRHYQKEEFTVFVGHDLVDPQIVDGLNDIKFILTSLGHEFNADHPMGYQLKTLPTELKQRFKQVPNDFRDGFEKDIENAIQDVLGISTTPSYKLFKSRPAYRSCTFSDKALNPVIKDKITISTGDRTQIQDFFDITKIQYPEVPRHIHIDQSVASDRTGIGCSHVLDFVEINGIRLPIIMVDFIICIEPPPRPYEIPISRTREFIIWLIREGLNVYSVSYDSFQSRESIQIMSGMGINAFTKSVDKDDEDWKQLVAMYYEGRIVHYDHPLYRYELFELIHDRERRKVDHPPHSSKDLADGLCGSVSNAVEFQNMGQAPRIGRVKGKELPVLSDDPVEARRILDDKMCGRNIDIIKDFPEEEDMD